MASVVANPLMPAGSQICRGFKEHDQITCEVTVLFSQGIRVFVHPEEVISEVVRPRELVSFFK